MVEIECDFNLMQDVSEVKRKPETRKNTRASDRSPVAKGLQSLLNLNDQDTEPKKNNFNTQSLIQSKALCP